MSAAKIGKQFQFIYIQVKLYKLQNSPCPPHSCLIRLLLCIPQALAKRKKYDFFFASHFVPIAPTTCYQSVIFSTICIHFASYQFVYGIRPILEVNEREEAKTKTHVWNTEFYNRPEWKKKKGEKGAGKIEISFVRSTHTHTKTAYNDKLSTHKIHRNTHINTYKYIQGHLVSFITKWIWILYTLVCALDHTDICDNKRLAIIRYIVWRKRERERGGRKNTFIHWQFSSIYEIL